MSRLDAPLAERMRPRTLGEVEGQMHLTGDEGILQKLGTGSLPSLLLWGPPGSGKTTIARLYAASQGALLLPLSAVLSGVKDLRGAVDRAKAARDLEKRPTVLFVDEIHRWNKAQQDALLPHVESGLVTLIGATTENPSFQIIAALRSRCRLVQLNRLENEAITRVLNRALQDAERGLGSRALNLSEEAAAILANAADGDARRALRLLEDVTRGLKDGATIDRKHLESLIDQRDLLHDRDGDAHYDVVSAYIKSMRGSDPDAAIYWMTRMLEGGEPAEFIARRLVIFAAEDIGNADPNALRLAVAVADGVARIGLPEGQLLLAQGTTYCASAPKSDASYQALKEAKRVISKTGSLPVPLHLRNAPTRLMESLGHGAAYQNPHRHPGNIVEQSYLPEGLQAGPFYRPAPHGAERTIGERLAFWKNLLAKRRKSND